MHDLHTPDPGIDQDRLQDRHEVTVELERVDVRAVGCERQRERSQPGTDLEDARAGLEVGEIHDPTSGVGVDEEVLPERATRAKPVRVEEGANLR